MSEEKTIDTVEETQGKSFIVKRKGPGQPSLLTKEMVLSIEDLYLRGMTRKMIQEKLSINEGTWSNWYWNNTNDFRVRVQQWKLDRRLLKAESKLDEILDLPVTEDSKVVSTIAKTAAFVAETLGKAEYAKRSEHTGADGEDLTVNIVSYAKKKKLKGK